MCYKSNRQTGQVGFTTLITDWTLKLPPSNSSCEDQNKNLQATKGETNPSIWAKLVSRHAPEFAWLTTVFLWSPPYLTERLKLPGSQRIRFWALLGHATPMNTTEVADSPSSHRLSSLLYTFTQAINRITKCQSKKIKTGPVTSGLPMLLSVSAAEYTLPSLLSTTHQSVQRTDFWSWQEQKFQLHFHEKLVQLPFLLISNRVKNWGMGEAMAA